MGAKSIIELNGQRYDSKSGKILKSPSSVKNNPKTGRSTSEFINMPKRRNGDSHTSTTKNPKQTIKRNTAPPAVAHSPQKANTLMRSVVKKPAVTATKSVTRASSQIHKSSSLQLKKPTVIATPSSKFKRAQEVQKSDLVKHFSNAQSDLFRKIHSIDILQSPKAQATTALLETKQMINNSAAILGKGIKSKTDDLLMSGLSKADSHLQPEVILMKRKHKLRHGISLFITITAALVIIGGAGLFIYKNSPTLQIRYAAIRSHIAASIPGYIPNGYSLASPIGYQRNSVTLEFDFTPNTKSYVLNETGSNWDSETLLDNFLLPLNYKYQVVSEAGRTLFIYGKGSATWVNGGIWYRISGSANLSIGQITAIATSF